MGKVPVRRQNTENSSKGSKAMSLFRYLEEEYHQQREQLFKESEMDMCLRKATGPGEVSEEKSGGG